VEQAWLPAVARLTAPSRDQTLRSGNLSLKMSFDPLAIHVQTAEGRPVQRLGLDAETGSLSFLLGDEPVLRLGEGGPQFGGRGAADRMRSGQGGYRLRTHGGRGAVQWLIGTG